MITAENITTEKTEAIFHLLATACEKSRRVMRMAQDGSTDPENASDMLNRLLNDLTISLSEQLNP